MDANTETETRFRKDLVAALNASKGDFDFSKFVSESPISRVAANAVAEKLLAQVFVRSLDDRVVTNEERKKTDGVARLLEISPSRQKEILDRAGKSKYRSELAAARADGVITNEERADLQKLLGALVDQSADSPQIDSRSVSPAPLDSKENRIPSIQKPRRDATAAPSTTSSTFDEAKFRRSLRYQVNDTAESVLADMAFLRQFDRGHEKRSRNWKIAGFIGLPFFFIALLCFLNANTDRVNRDVSTTAGIVTGGVGLLLISVGFGMCWKHSSLDLDDRRYEVVAGLLRLLSKDMADDARVTVKIDFRPHNHARKLLRKGKAGYWNVKFFVDRWLEVSGSFVDGTKYSVTLIEKQQDRHRTKRSASGKTKHKYKTKNSSEAIISLKIKQKRYPRAQGLYGKFQKTVKLPPWVNLKSVRADGDRLTLRTTTPTKWDAVGPEGKRPKRDGVNWMAMMFLSLYRLLNVSK